VAGLGFRRPSQAQRLFTEAAELATLLVPLRAWGALVAEAIPDCRELRTRAAAAAVLSQMLLEQRGALALLFCATLEHSEGRVEPLHPQVDTQSTPF
jgi:hypothetical protein